MQPNQPPSPGNPPATTGIATQATSTAAQVTATQTIAIAGVQNAAQQPATVTNAAAVAIGDPPLAEATHRASEAQENRARRELAAQALVALQELPAPQQAPVAAPQQPAPLTTNDNALINYFINRIPGLQLAPEHTVQLEFVIHHKRSAAFNYMIAMRLSFSEATLAACQEHNQVQHFLLLQINNETQPYIRLKLLIMAFLRFYNSTEINLSRCAQLFNIAAGTISGWYSGNLNSLTCSIESISRFIANMRQELQDRGETLIMTQAAQLPREQTTATEAPEETNNSCWTTFGLIDRTSLASILHPLYQMLGLRWNNQE
ncbi:MAG: hypothetical protein ACRC9T_03765, partial [Vibrionaceae bacterium]